MEVASGQRELLTGARDPCLVTSNFINELEDFSALANFCLFADSLQSRNITEAVMGDFELMAEEIGLLDAGTLDLVGPGEESTLIRYAPRHDARTARCNRGFRGSRGIEGRPPVCIRIEKANHNTDGTQVPADGTGAC